MAWRISAAHGHLGHDRRVGVAGHHVNPARPGERERIRIADERADLVTLVERVLDERAPDTPVGPKDDDLHGTALVSGHWALGPEPPKPKAHA
jgi:hypothetical protein